MTLLAVLFAAKVWHYWAGIMFLALSIVGTLAIGVGYLVKVTSMKYPKQ